VIPVDNADRFFLLAERTGPPVSCVWAFRFDTDVIDRDRFVRAVGCAMRRYPKAGSQLGGRETLLGPELFWRPLEDAAARTCAFHQEPQSTRARLSAQVARFINERLDLRTGPPVRLHWFPAEPGRGLVFMHFHHALTDGVGSLAFLKALFDAYRGAVSDVPSAARPPESSTRTSRHQTARAFVGLLAHSARQARRHAFVGPDKLFAASAVPSGGVGVEWRSLRNGSPERCRGAARNAGVSVGSLLLAAIAAGIAAWKRERGLSCRMLRVMVNVNLKRHELPAALGHTSSAIPIWIGADELVDPPRLPGLIHRQVVTATRKRFADAVRSLSVMMRLPAWAAHAVLGPALRRRTGTDSLIVTNMGDLSLPGHPSKDWLRIGDARLLDAYAFVPPVEGIGAAVTMLESAGALRVCLTYIEGLLSPGHAVRLLDLTEVELQKLCDA
jgi:NRPS condensation-like uncharacterized protein